MGVDDNSIVLKRLPDESNLQYIWRICRLKDSGIYGGTWKDVAEIINDELGNSYSEAAYRKKYQQAKMFYDDVFSVMDGVEYIDDIQIQKQELFKERQKLSDERSALRKKLRDRARLEEDLNILKKAIEHNNIVFPKYNPVVIDGDTDMIICVSDVHLGISCDNHFGKYNSEIAKEYFVNYLQEIERIQKTHNAKSAYVLMLGDLVSGSIHFTTQLENRENVIQQAQTVAELLSSFVYELGKRFTIVKVVGVAGNHSRLSYKDQVLRNERLDNIIPWYMKAKLERYENIQFADDWIEQYDDTIARVFIRNKEYIAVHGDFDSFSESGVSKLVMMIGHKPTAVFYGHLHHCSYDDISDVKIIRSGSFCGICDDFTVSKRLNGKPMQMVCIVNDDGVEALYPVVLK